MAETIRLDFKAPDPGPIAITLGDTLLITGTPGATRNEAYVYKFSANGKMFEEFYITGISLETGGGPDKNYVIPDTLLTVAGTATTVTVEVEQRYRYIYSPPEDDIVMTTRTLIVTIPDTVIRYIALEESEATAAIKTRFGSFIQRQSRVAVRLTADAPVGSSIARIDIYDGEGTKGDLLGSLVLPTNTTVLTSKLVPEDIPAARAGPQQRTIVITDKRGRKMTRTLPLTVTAYYQPVITHVKLRRAEADGTPSAAGERVLAQVEAGVQSLMVGGVEKNTVKLTFRYRRIASSDDWEEGYVYPPMLDINQEFLLPNAIRCLLDGNYAFEVVLSDWFTSVTRNSLITTSGALLSFNRFGTGVAIGKRSTEDQLLDVALPSKFGMTATFAAPAFFASDVDMVIPLPPESGGTGVRSFDELKAALGLGSTFSMQRGSVSYTLAASATATTQTIMFPKPFAAVPTVLLQLQLMTTFNVVSYAVSYISTNYFQFQTTNGNTAQKSCVMHWIAFGDLKVT